MVYLLSAIIILIGIIGGGTLNIIQLFKQQGQQSASTITRERLDEAAQAIIENTYASASSTAYGFYPPAADKLSGIAYSTIPTWLSLTSRNATGVPFAYCPFSNVTSGTKSQTVTKADGTTYAVAETILYSGATRKFVTVSDAAPSNAADAIAIIAAPANNITPPSCATVDANGQIAGAYTRIITRQDLRQRQLRIAQAAEKIFVAPSATGDGSGHSPSNRLTLNQSLDYLKLFEPSGIRLELATGTHTLTGTAQTIGTSALMNTGVEWVGADNSTLINNSSNFNFTLLNKNRLVQMNVPSNQSTYLGWNTGTFGGMWLGDIRPSRINNNSGGRVYYGGNYYTGNFTNANGGVLPSQQSAGGDRTYIDGTIQIECVDFTNRRGYFTANSTVNNYYRDNTDCGSVKRAYLDTTNDQAFINGVVNGVYTGGTSISTTDYGNDLLNGGSGDIYTCGATFDGGGAMALINNRSGGTAYFGCQGIGNNLAYGTALVWGNGGQGGIGFDGGTYNVAGAGPYAIGGYSTKLYGGGDGSWPTTTFNLNGSGNCWVTSTPNLFADSGNANGNYSRATYSTAANYWLYTYNRSNWLCNR